MHRENQKQHLIRVIHRLHQRGWCDGTGGNFSVVSEQEPLRLLMASSGVDKGSIQTTDLIEVNDQGNVVQGKGKASAETLMHLQIIKQCSAGAVLHTHSLNATVLSRLHQATGQITLEGWEMLKGLAGINTHSTKIHLPIIGNDQDLKRLSEAASKCLDNAPSGLLVAGHGMYAWGDDLFQAQRHTEIIEFLLDLSWRQTLLNTTEKSKRSF